jgi:hypothetical protein
MPLNLLFPGTSMATVRLELAKEESSQQEDTLPHETSPSVFLQVALDLEDQQRALQSFSKDKMTLAKEGDIEEKRNVLRRRIQAWMEVRKVYVPVLTGDDEIDSTPMTHKTPELMPLKLPSSMAPALRSTCFKGLADTECRLRLAQADDALCDLRKQLRIAMGLAHYKNTQVDPSQRAATRARSLISRFHEKTMRCAERYRAAYSALAALDPCGEWSNRLRHLADADIRQPRRGDDEAEGTREVSWIWRVDRRSGLRDELRPLDNDELDECEWHYLDVAGHLIDLVFRPKVRMG